MPDFDAFAYPEFLYCPEMDSLVLMGFLPLASVTAEDELRSICVLGSVNICLSKDVHLQTQGQTMQKRF